MINSANITTAIVLSLLGAHSFAAAPDDSASIITDLNLNGSLRSSYWNVSDNPNGRNSLGINELWLKSSPRVSDNATLLLEGWVRSPNENSSTDTHGMLREAYLKFSSGAADFRIGKQIIVWGRADQINPTDNLSPRDYTMFTADSYDQRHGTTAASVTYNFTSIAATAIWLPRFKPYKVPIPPAPGVSISENVPTGDQFAFKLNQYGMDMDWSLSYFSGYDLNPDIAIESVQSNALNLSLQHHRIRVLGADAATVLGRYGVRAEVAYTWTENSTNINPFIKNPFLYGVVGADRTFFSNLNINVQYFSRYIRNFSDPNAIADPMIRSVAIQQSIISNQQDRFQQGMSLRISNKWLNETLDAELTAVYNLTRADYLLRPKVRYAFNDYWKGTLGANLFRGDPNTYFGMLDYFSTAFVELRYSF